MTLILSILGLLVFTVVAGVAIAFIIYYFGVYLAMAGIAIGAIVGMVKESQNKKIMENEQLSKEEFEQIKRKAKEYHGLLLPLMTDFIRSICSIFPLEIPKADSDILPKRRWTIGANKLILLHFAINKLGDCDVEKMMQVLQHKIYQKLVSGEISFISPRLILWNGDLWPSICVDSIRDNGTHLEITVVFNSKDYIQTMEARKRANLRAAIPAANQIEDVDFE